MPSRALVIWESEQQVELDRLDAAHLCRRRRGAGPRAATVRARLDVLLGTPPW
jgi:hypothetical protein